MSDRGVSEAELDGRDSLGPAATPSEALGPERPVSAANRSGQQARAARERSEQERGVSRGAVISAGCLQAADAGAAVLASGGNAVDAAITASAVQCVRELPWCGLGGDAFALVSGPEGQLEALNGAGAVPRALATVFDPRRHPAPLRSAVDLDSGSGGRLVAAVGPSRLASLRDPDRAGGHPRRGGVRPRRRLRRGPRQCPGRGRRRRSVRGRVLQRQRLGRRRRLQAAGAGPHAARDR